VLGRYYAGIWSSAATQQLAWYTVAEEELGKGQYRAPSWSWGATHNEVFRGGGYNYVCCLLVNIETKLKHEGVLYREVLEGFATLRASLLLGKASGHRFSNVYTTYCVHESPMTRFFNPLPRWQYHRRFAVRLVKKKAGWYLSIK
jgi:hypothetical protein